MRKLTTHPLLSFAVAAIIGSTFSVAANANPVKILPLGDSITQGTKGEQSYRKPLIQELDLIGCSYEMVGSRIQTNRPDLEPNPVFESPHDGYSGHAANDFLNATTSNGIQNPGINSIMDAENPDVILVHIGSNDMTRGQPVGSYNPSGSSGTIAEIELLATRIWNKNPIAEILIANVIPWFGSSNNPNIGSDVEDLGDAIEAWVTSENDSRLHLVDVRSNYLSSYMNADGIHPNQNGDAHIADAFLQVIEDNSLCPEGFPPATFISSPAVAGELLPLTHTFTGTATDQGGSGFDRVRVAIEDDNHTDNSDRWYNFSSGTFGTFDSKNATLTNVTTASLDWEVTATMPSGGSYTIYALAIDNNGNQDYDGPPALWPTNRNFTVANDTTPPATTIDSPATDAIVQSPVNLTGTAADTGGSGFGRVELRLRNLTTQQWYDFDSSSLGSVASLGVASLTNTTTNSTNWNLNLALPDGAYRLWAISIDGVGNIDLASGTRQWVTRDFTVAPPDTVAPSTTIITPSSGANVQSTVTLSGIATDTGGAGFGRVELRLRNLTTQEWYDFNTNSLGNISTIGLANLSSTTTNGTDWDLALTLPNGTYRLWAIAIDSEGNIDLSQSGTRQWASTDFTVVPADTIAPVTTIATPTANASVQNPVNISGTATDSGGAGFGTVELRLRNITTQQWYNFDTGTLGSTASLGVANLSNTTTGATDWNINLNLADGKYRIYAIAIDALGNVNMSGTVRQWITREFTVEFPDTISPATTISTPANNATLQNSVVISGNATDTGGAGFGRVELRLRNITTQQWYNFNTASLGSAASLGLATLSNTTVNSTDWNVNLTLPDGRYRIQAIAIDAKGNIALSGGARQWTVREFDVLPADSIAPVTNITNPTQNDNVQSPLTISGTATDTGGAGFGRVELRLRNLTTQQWYNFNNGSLGSAASLGIASLNNTTIAQTDWSVNVNLPNGRYRIQAIAIDAQGNIDLQGGARQWVIHEFDVGPQDATAPDTTITSPGSSGDILNNAFTVTGTATDAGGSGFDRVELLLRNQDTGQWYNFNTGSFGANPVLGTATLTNTSTATTNWNKSFTLADGSYRIQAIAYDSAGNKKETATGGKQWVIHFFDVE